MSIELITRDDGTKAVEFKNHGAERINSITSVHDFTLGTLNNGVVQVGHHNEWKILVTISVPMTEAEHADVKDHLDIPEVSRVAGEPHTSPKPLSERFGILTNLVTGLLERVRLLEAIDERIFVKWIVRGTEFQCEMPNVKDGLASFDLKDGFDGFSEDLNPDDPNDSRQMLYLKTREFGTFRIITARQELGRIRDAVNANSDVAVHSEPLPAEEED